MYLLPFKCQGDTKRQRISEVNVAKTLLKATNFNKDSVHTQCILFKNVGDVFATDVMYLSNCLNKYFKTIRYDVDSLMKQKMIRIDDLVKNLGSTFWALSATCTRIDIVFNLYKEKSIKSNKRDRQSDGKGILTNVCPLIQPLSVEMKKFWALFDNKVSFQQIFIKWMKESQNEHTCLFLGGTHSEDETMHWRHATG